MYWRAWLIASSSVARSTGRKDAASFHSPVFASRYLRQLKVMDRLCCAQHNRSITIAPRRYRDQKTGKWEDASSLRPMDLPSLLLALEAAHRYVTSTPLPGLSADGEALDDAGSPEDGEVAP